MCADVCLYAGLLLRAKPGCRRLATAVARAAKATRLAEALLPKAGRAGLTRLAGLTESRRARLS